MDVFLDEAEFYEIEEHVIRKFKFEEGIQINRDSAADMMPPGLLAKKIWLLFDFPESSMQVKIYFRLATVTILVKMLHK